MAIAASLYAIFGNAFLVKALQDSTELPVSDKIMGDLNAFFMTRNDPQNTGNDKEKFLTNFAAAKKVFSFLHLPGLETTADDSCLIRRDGPEGAKKD